MSDAATPMNGAAAKAAPEKAAKAVRKTVRKVAHKAERAAHEVGQEARSFAAEADEARDKLVAAAIRRAHARRAMARRWARHQAALAGEAVQTRPLTSIGAALGVGIIIGLLAAR
jgi:ElaB/YqjD/DUF883 family membrane-anchored ribosome-binding protein